MLVPNRIRASQAAASSTVSTTGVITTSIATSIDWTPKMTPVKDQGQCGSCWVFSAVGVIEGKVRIKNGSVYDFAEQEIVDCCNYRLSSRICSYSDGCNGGIGEQTLQYIGKSGIAL